MVEKGLLLVPPAADAKEVCSIRGKVNKTVIRFTLEKPEISTGSMPLGLL